MTPAELLDVRRRATDPYPSVSCFEIEAVLDELDLRAEILAGVRRSMSRLGELTNRVRRERDRATNKIVGLKFAIDCWQRWWFREREWRVAMMAALAERRSEIEDAAETDAAWERIAALAWPVEERS